MVHFQLLLAGVVAPMRLRVGELAGRALILLGDTSLSDFFTNLYGKLTVFALAVATFFFAWAAILYMASGTDNERGKQHAQGALYAALIGLALALLAGTVAGIINSSALGH